MDGRVERVHLAPEGGGAVESVEDVEAVADRGLRGDRYFLAEGTFQQRDGRDLTLIEVEALAAIEREAGVSLAPGEHRRNVTTRGVALNHLVGERFRVGDAVCEGVLLCEPCSYLEGLVSSEGVGEALVHRGGLRADVIESGTISEGDAVVALDQ
jgi:MOSC domain-containing protein YiiM